MITSHPRLKFKLQALALGLSLIAPAGALPGATFTPATQQVSAAGGTYNLTIDPGENSGVWGLRSYTFGSALWLSWSAVTYTGTATVPIIVAPNLKLEERDATVLAGGTYDLTGSHWVTQSGAAPFLTVSPTSVSVPSSGGAYNLIITTNLDMIYDYDWDDNTPAGFATPDFGRGLGPKTISITISNNSSVQPRSGNLIFETLGNAGGDGRLPKIFRTVSFVQAGSPPTASINPLVFNAPNSGAVYEMELWSNTSWSLGTLPPWVDITPSSRTLSSWTRTVLSVSLDANPDGVERSVSFTVNNKTHTIHQGADHTIAPELNVNGPGGALTSDASSVDFGSSPIGVARPPQSFTIRNDGTQTLDNLTVAVIGPHSADFVISGAMGSSLTPFFGNRTGFTVTFTPSGSGPRTATLRITSNDPDENPFDVALTGGGTVPLSIVQEAYIKASNPNAGDSFGYAVAISGDTLVIGAYLEDSNATGVNGDQSNNASSGSGAVYVFVRDGATWTQQAYLKASNAGSPDGFGVSVAISGDTLVVGALNERSSATMVNGAQNDDSVTSAGAAYVFVRTGATWSQQAYLKPSNTGANDQFGSTIAISGDTVVVGAPGEDSSATGINGNQADNSVLSSGAAYVFVRNGSAWSQQAYIKASNTGYNDQFGLAVAIAGNTLVVGAPQEDSNLMGVNNGDQADDSLSNSGAAYVFVRSGASWTQQAFVKPANTASNGKFGISVSLEEELLAIGASGMNGTKGAAFVFARSGTDWTQQAYLTASNAEVDDAFGAAVALSGETLIVGAHGEDGSFPGIDNFPASNSMTDAGAAYAFVRNANLWSQAAYIKSSNPGTTGGGSNTVSDRFGQSLALAGDMLIVGAYGEDSAATGVNSSNQGDSFATWQTGAAYLFDLRHVPEAPEIALEDSTGSSLSNGGGQAAYSILPPEGGVEARTFTIRNTGTADLIGIAATVSGPQAESFSITDAPAASLPAGGSTTVTVAFSPDVAGSHIARLSITSNDADESPFHIDLKGDRMNAQQGFDVAMSLNGLTGPDAEATATPHDDGVANLLKYAFNMNAAGADVRMLTPGSGTAGLPSVTRPNDGIFHVEFLRRIGSGLAYEAQMSPNLEPDSWEALSIAPNVIPIDATWERVTYDQPYDPLLFPRLFGRVSVSLP